MIAPLGWQSGFPALASLALFSALWLRSNRDLFRDRRFLGVFAGCGLVLLAAKQAWIPLENYEAGPFDLAFNLLLHPVVTGAEHFELDTGRPGLTYGRLYVTLFILLERILFLLGWTRLDPALPVEESFPFPSFFDEAVLLAGTFALLGACRKESVPAVLSAIAVVVIALNPSSLFFASVQTDHWTAAIVAAIVAFSIREELRKEKRNLLRLSLVAVSGISTAFYFRYTNLILLPAFAAGLIAGPGTVRQKAAVLLGTCAAIAALCWIETTRIGLLSETVTTITIYHQYGDWGERFARSFHPLNGLSAFSVEALARLLFPLFLLPSLGVLALGFRSLPFGGPAEKSATTFLLLFLSAAAFVPFTFIHPGERQLLPFLLALVPVLGKGLQALQERSRRGLLLAAIVGLAGGTGLGLHRLGKEAFRSGSFAPETFSDTPRVLDAKQRMKLFAEAAGPGGTLHLIFDFFGPLPKIEDYPFRLKSYHSPAAVTFPGFREEPTFLILEPDAYGRTTLYRRSARILLESRFDLEFLGTFGDHRHALFQLQPRSGWLSSLERLFRAMIVPEP